MAKTKNSSKRNFDDLSVQECHLIYPALLENAERHYKIGQELADMREFGAAIAHLTIAAEEYIQAMTIYFQGWGMPVQTIKKLSRYFDDKDTGFAVSPTTIVLGTYLRSLYNIFESLTQSLFSLQFLDFKKIFDQQLNPLPMVKKSTYYASWWSGAKQRREKGLYTQFEMNLTSPADFTAKDYELSLEVVNDLRENCLTTIEFTKKIPEKQRILFFKWIKNYFEPFMKRLNKLPLPKRKSKK